MCAVQPGLIAAVLKVMKNKTLIVFGRVHTKTLQWRVRDYAYKL
jgi:hypothetical protein